MRVLNAILASATLLSWATHAFARFEKSAFRLEHPVIHPSSSSDALLSQFNITTGIDGKDQNLAFVLETNHDLAAHNTHVEYLDVHGNSQPVDISSYQTTKGSVWLQSTGRSWKNVGWARIVVIRRGQDPLFEGTFTVKSKHYEIRLQSPDELTAGHEKDQLMVYRTSSSNIIDLSPEVDPVSRPACLSTPQITLSKRQLNERDDNLINTIGTTAGCPQARQIAYIGVAADCTYSAAFSSLDAVHRNILNLVNTASVVFETSYNISLGLRNLTIADRQCPNRTAQLTSWNSACPSGDMNWRLQRFSSWRGTVRDSNAYWTLLTDCHNSGGEVGVSWVGELCNRGSGLYDGSQSGIGANVVARTKAQWQVFTHESAHMFGAVHDCNSDACDAHLDTTTNSSQCCPLSSTSCDADGDFIMNPSSTRAMSRFSACTIGDVCSQLGSGRVDTHCLVPSTPGLNMTGVNNGQCGNGVLEPGEACDCAGGGCTEQQAHCCDDMTCQWRGGDECERFNPGSGSNRSWAQKHLGLVVGLSVGLGGALVFAVAAVVGIFFLRRRRIARGRLSLSSTSTGPEK